MQSLLIVQVIILAQLVLQLTSQMEQQLHHLTTITRLLRLILPMEKLAKQLSMLQ